MVSMSVCRMVICMVFREFLQVFSVTNGDAEPMDFIVPKAALIPLPSQISNEIVLKSLDLFQQQYLCVHVCVKLCSSSNWVDSKQ